MPPGISAINYNNGIVPKQHNRHILHDIVSPERCNPPEEIENGTISFFSEDPSNILIGDSITYSCENGSRLEGPVQRYCLRSGNWSEYEPQCISKKILMVMR